MHEQMNISKETDKRKENQENINNFFKKLGNRDEEYLLQVNTWIQQSQG